MPHSRCDPGPNSNIQWLFGRPRKRRKGETMVRVTRELSSGKYRFYLHLRPAAFLLDTPGSQT